MITLAVAVHAADALVEPADDERQLLVEIDVGTLQQQVGRRGKMGFVRPFGAQQRAREQSFADVRDFGV